jgi:hypothetical protein
MTPLVTTVATTILATAVVTAEQVGNPGPAVPPIAIFARDGVPPLAMSVALYLRP